MPLLLQSNIDTALCFKNVVDTGNLQPYIGVSAGSQPLIGHKTLVVLRNGNPDKAVSNHAGNQKFLSQIFNNLKLHLHGLGTSFRLNGHQVAAHADFYIPSGVFPASTTEPLKTMTS